MRKLRLMPVIMSLLLLSGCGSTGKCSSEGYETAEEAYQAYLDAVLAGALTGDSSGFPALFSGEEQKAALKATRAFMRRQFALTKDSYQVYLSNAKPEGFAALAADECAALHRALTISGTDSNAWTVLPGEANPQDKIILRDFSDMLELNVTGIVTYSAFTLQNSNDETKSAEGKPTAVIALDGKWYPCYLAECAL